MVFFGQGLGEHKPTALAHALGSLALLAGKQLVGGQQRGGFGGRCGHEHAALAVVEQAAAV